MSESNDYNQGSLGTYTTGSAPNQLGLAQHRHQQQEWIEEGRATRRPKARFSTDPDRRIRIILSVVVSALAGYLESQTLAVPWYWPLGTITLLAIVFYRLLLGPLRIVVTTLKWVLLLCGIAFVACAVLRFFETLRTASK
jgi:hypothetical protein